MRLKTTAKAHKAPKEGNATSLHKSAHLTPEEIKDIHGLRATSVFERVDVNRDGGEPRERDLFAKEWHEDSRGKFLVNIIDRKKAKQKRAERWARDVRKSIDQKIMWYRRKARALSGVSYKPPEAIGANTLGTQTWKTATAASTEKERATLHNALLVSFDADPVFEIPRYVMECLEQQGVFADSLFDDKATDGMLNHE